VLNSLPHSGEYNRASRTSNEPQPNCDFSGNESIGAGNITRLGPDGKPGPVRTMESQLTKHILPRFGSLTLDAVDETGVQEFVADLKRATLNDGNPKAKIVSLWAAS
jgi:hypothetical protein